MNTSAKPVAAIVAAFNEEKTIGPIVKTLADSGRFRDVIVISDGSTDHTADIARQNGASLVHQFPWKHGKGAAMMHGVSHTDAPVIFFCDADLHGLSVEHLDTVMKPVLDGKMAMCVGIRDRGTFLMKVSALLPLIGGERALERRVFEDIPDRYLQGFMVEGAMNYYCRSRRLPYGTVELPGLTIVRKMQKVGFWKGLKEYIHMGWQIWKAILVVRLARLRGDF
ncbi:glycosyltransferase family 2 protein [Patescibacteria group bacterium]|nr:glycosyltransferase family 2 protein [Patescibacteria group bacterium]MBU1448821.1 glycosyltransferase family 2 protein [Patescibacteria group bacterium]MBU2613081.1 glycosyltransferase family 2 protein [Patescibacteria group bacterium]